MNPRYPIYIPSKGRAESRVTMRVLDKLHVSYRVVVEDTEYDAYAAVIDPAKLLRLPFHDLGQGSIPARNWIWEHALAEGHARHWVLDDNIRAFWRMNRNRRFEVTSGTIFRCVEDFTERYTNVGISGMHHYGFVREDYSSTPPFYLNHRVYSMILLDTSLPFRWRGRYNEDTDLCLRVLKAGYCTLLVAAFTGQKMPTMTMRGGNTDHVYTDGDNRLRFAQSLVEQHPDVARVTWKFNRWHHHVDYDVFRTKLQLRPGVQIPAGVDNYGMVLVDLRTGRVVDEQAHKRLGVVA